MPRTIYSTGPALPPYRAYTAGQTAYPAFAATATAFSDDGQVDGVFLLPTPVSNYTPPTRVFVMPFGVGTAGQTFKAAVVLYYRTQNGLLVPQGAAEFTCTLGALTGVAGQDVLNTEKFCDVVSAPTKGTAGVDCQPLAPVAGSAGSFWVERKSAVAFAVVATISGGTATSGNALVGLLR